MSEVTQTLERIRAPIHDWAQKPHISLGSLGAELPLDAEEAAIWEMLHGFAERVMRPAGKSLDRTEPARQLDPGSAYWDFVGKFRDLGITVAGMAEMEPLQRAKFLCLFYEELGWGDGGLAIATGVTMLPHVMMRYFARFDLIERYPETLVGCWAITEPDHGSDMLDSSQQIFHAKGQYGRPNCIATFKGDTVVLNGQKSAWVSNAPAAELCVLYVAADTGAGVDPQRGACIIVPLDLPGVTKGKVLAKLGQRPLPQGELFFDNVELPISNVLAGPEDYHRAVYAVHAEANAFMGLIWTGAARAAYELAYDYAHERKQGGVPIIRHQSVAQRLFHMARKVEIGRALSRRAVLFNAVSPTPSLPTAMMAKVTGTQNAFEVASEALQIFGGNGMTDEYPIEKIFRDTRLSLIEDGCNEILAVKGGFSLADQERLR
jgi:acyl-CoA dehydrogenase